MGDFFHDVPPEVTAQAFALGDPPQSATPFAEPWLLANAGRADEVSAGPGRPVFPLEFQRRVVQEPLGAPVEEMPGGHLLALSRPRELADRLEAYLADARPSP
jgi:hypothetical protein